MKDINVVLTDVNVYNVGIIYRLHAFNFTRNPFVRVKILEALKHILYCNRYQ